MIKKIITLSSPIIAVIALLSILFYANGNTDKTTDSFSSAFNTATNSSDDIPEEYIEISNRCRYQGIEFDDKTIFTIDNIIPTSRIKADKYNHTYFILGYSNRHKQSVWCAWILNRYMVKNKIVKRENSFREDSTLKCCMSFNSDYNRSEYDRGHLCPSGDMTWNKKANKETFLLSNICPQNKKLNQGRWNDLEKLTRAWAVKNDSLLIITGPILEPNKGFIGKSKVTVPSAFYKIIIDISAPKCKAIAFVMPNDAIKDRLFSYTVSIKDVEKLTGLNFFPKFDKNNIVQSLENMCDTSAWK